MKHSNFFLLATSQMIVSTIQQAFGNHKKKEANKAIHTTLIKYHKYHLHVILITKNATIRKKNITNFFIVFFFFFFKKYARPGT